MVEQILLAEKFGFTHGGRVNRDSTSSGVIDTVPSRTPQSAAIGQSERALKPWSRGPGANRSTRR